MSAAADDPLRLDRDSEHAAGIVEQVKDLDAERLKRIVDRQRELPPRSESLDAANELATREEAAACAFCFRRIRDILTENRLEGTSASDEVVVAEAGRNAALAYLLGDRLDEPDRRSLLGPWLAAVGEPPATGDLVELALQDKNSQRVDGSILSPTSTDRMAYWHGTDPSSVSTGNPTPQGAAVSGPGFRTQLSTNPRGNSGSRQDRGTRRRVAVSVLSVTLVVGGIAWWVATNTGAGTAAGPTTAVPTTADAGVGVATETISVGAGPVGVAVGEGAVWVANGGDGTVSRIDPGGGDVTDTIPVGAGPVGVAAGEGAVWVTNGDDDTVSRIDPLSRAVTDTIDGVGTTPTGVAIGEGAVWVVANSSDGQAAVSQIDPVSRAVVDTIEVSIAPAEIAVGDGSVWVASYLDFAVLRIDPTSGAVADTIDIGVSPGTVGREGFGVAVGVRSVWVTSGIGRPARGGGSVSRIDSASGQVVDVIDVDDLPIAVVVGEGAVWVVNSFDAVLGGGGVGATPEVGTGTVSRIDPDTGEVIESIAVGTDPGGAAVGEGSVWVTNGSDDTVSRIQP